MRVLILGAGEIGEAWSQKIAQSPLASTIYVWPQFNNCSTLDVKDHASVVELAKEASRQRIDVVICCNEGLLEQGITNALQVFRIPCFGPTRSAFQVATDKILNNLGENPKGTSRSCVAFVGRNRAFEIAADPDLPKDAGKLLQKTIVARILEACAWEDVEFSGILNISFVWQNSGPLVTDISCKLGTPDQFPVEKDWLKMICDIMRVPTGLRAS